jgi:hypothetical protein
MNVKQAREVARQWVIEKVSGIPGFCGAYTAGSMNWVRDDADLATTSDFDIIVVVADPNRAGKRGKFVYRDTLLEVSYLSNDQLCSSDLVLGDYHLAPSLRTTSIILDPSGHLTELLAIVCCDYAKRQWVLQRCANARNKILGYLRSINEESTHHDQVIACLFAAGITTHVLLVAGLRNPTVRARYMAARELLAEYGHLEFHDALLGLLGCARISRERVDEHLTALTHIFDAAKEAIKTPFPFASDISHIARPMAIDGSLELIERGYHREAMFWIAVTHSRCHKVLSRDAPEKMKQSFRHNYRDLASDLGMLSFVEIRQRCTQIERVLPRVWEVAEAIMSANRGIEDH